MSVRIVPLFEPAVLTNAAARYYVSTGVNTTIDKMTASNPSTTTPYSVTVYWVPLGGAAGSTNILIPSRFVQPLEALDLYGAIGQTLGVGDEIWALASTTAVLNFFASGRTFS